MLSPSLTRNFLVGGLILAGLAGCDRQTGADKQPPANQSESVGEPAAGQIDTSHKGSRLPDLTFKNAAGQQIRTSSLAGKPVLINLWATWCGPCVAELPTLDAVAAKGAVQVLTLSQDGESSAAKVAPFLAGKGLTHLGAWLDPQMSAAQQWQVGTLPASILYDAQGREVWRMNGGMEWTSAKGQALLAQGMAQKL